MGPEWIVVGVIAVAVLFGAKKIPEMARSVGRAQGEFKRGMREGAIEESEAPAPGQPADTPPPAAQSPATGVPPAQSPAAPPPAQGAPPASTPPTEPPSQQPPTNGSQR